jgi:uncharacterized protein (TIGR00251 family)
MSADGLRVRAVPGGVRLTVRVQPRAATSAIAGVHGEAMKVRLTAPPVDGAANEALVNLLAEYFRIPRRAITIVSGTSARTKVVELAGVTEDHVRRLMER